MRPHPDLRFRASETFMEALFQGEVIATAEVLRAGDWLVRRCEGRPCEPAYSIHEDRDGARMALVSWSRGLAWRRERWPWGRNPVAKHLRRAP